MKCLILWIHTVFIAGVLSQQSAILSIGVCDHPWTPAYAHDYRGFLVVGSLVTFQEQIQQGYMVRVQFSTKEWLITFALDDFTFRGSHVCGSSTWFMSDNGTHIDTDADWLPTLVCTNGEVSRLNFSSASWNVIIGQQDLPLDGEVWWYTKPTHCSEEPIYSQFVDGSAASGSLSKLMRLAKMSELRANMRDRGYSFVLQNQKIYNNELLTAQSINHISLRYTQDSVKFNDDPYYSWISVWSTNGRRDVSRWYLENTTLHKHNNDFVSLDWYGDECWRKVFSADNFGFATYGSLNELVQMIKLGHRVRMHFDGVTLKANGIRVVDGLVVAQTIEEFHRRGTYPNYDAPFFDNKAKAVYRLVHSTGMEMGRYMRRGEAIKCDIKDQKKCRDVVKTYMYTIDDFKLAGMSQTKYAIDWLVDTRPWRKILRTDALGVSTDGSPRDLEDAVYMGASVRLNIEQDELAGQFFTEADNVRVSFYTNEVYAQALKHVSDEKVQSVDEYSLQNDVFRWALMVSSGGVVAMNARRLASKSHLYDAVSPATNVTWFVNQ